MIRNMLTGAETVKLGIIITEHCRAVPGTGGCAYDEGWSDKKIAEESHGAFNENNVKGLRRQLFGSLVAPPPAPVVDPAVVALSNSVILIEHNFNILIERLTANGQLDLLDIKIE